MPLAAHEWLRSDGVGKPAWAVFDAAWYLGRYAAARDYCGGDLGAALGYYLEIGTQLAHSPSPVFDEAYYLAENPDVSELVRAGNYASGFDHFCRYGHRVLSPHWLFDDGLYGRLHEDMTLENLDQHAFFGRYDHYLRSGQHERRLAHLMFDAGFYCLRLIEAGEDAGAAESLGPFSHYLQRLHSEKAELPASIYFEPQWYLAGDGVRAAIEAGRFGSAIEHYLRNDAPDLRDPLPQFSEAYYREVYRDIDEAVETGLLRNGYQHFVQFGAFELRRPNQGIDLRHYRDANPRVRDDLNTGAARDAFAHLRRVGLREGLAYRPADAAPEISEAAVKQMQLRRARDLLVLFARRPLDFTAVAPRLSVILVAHDRFELTMLALASLRNNFSGDIELILVDNGSADGTRWIARYVTGAKLLVLAENIGFPRAANLGLAQATAPAVLYLNNDTELAHGAVAAALARLGGDAGIGAVVGKIIRSHGRLQEAGSIIWRDGETAGYLRDESPLAGEANFLRDVDYGSAVFLLCRRGILNELRGFDEDFSPAYYEDADLCLRIAGAGHRIVYDPAVVVHHLEYGSAAHDQAATALMRRGRKIFVRKHKAALADKYEKSDDNILHARAPRAGKRVLFFEDTVPLRRLGSGFVRANDVVRAIVAAGYEITVFPINGAPYDELSLLADMPETAECLYGQTINTLAQFLAARNGYYDIVWISRTHNLGRVLPILQAAGYDLPIVLDTEAVAANRALAAASLWGNPADFDFEGALRAEFAQADACRHLTAVNRAELDLLHGLGLPAVSLLGTIREAALTPAEFEQRNGLLFVAGIHQADSPNLDSLRWYAEDILPALALEMDEPPLLHIVGHAAAGIDLSAFHGNPQMKFHGEVAELRPFYESARVFIAPTRFAAGTPYKIYEAAAHGVPVVATELLAQQLSWRPGTDLLTAPARDARRFAAQIAVLYRTKTLWTKIRTAAAGRLAVENTKAVFDETVAEVLQAAQEKAEQGQGRRSFLKKRTKKLLVLGGGVAAPAVTQPGLD